MRPCAPKKNRESRVQSAYSPDEIIAVVSARDARRIWRRSLPTCGRGIPYRAILPRRVSLHRRFASAQRQTLLNVSDSVEQFKKIALGCVERQVANVQTRRSNFNPFRFACWSRRLRAIARGCFWLRCAISKKCGNPLPECLFWLLRFFSLTTRGAIATASGTATRTVRASPS